MRYDVTVTAPDGRFLCAATLRCTDGEVALRRFLELPLPDGLAELRRSGRLIARRPSETRGVLVS